MKIVKFIIIHEHWWWALAWWLSLFNVGYPLFVLLGYWQKIEHYKRIGRAGPEMSLNTALGFLLFGITLLITTTLNLRKMKEECGIDISHRQSI